MSEPCPICDDSGFRLIDRPDGTRFAAQCECRVVSREARIFTDARIPKRFLDCTLDAYRPNFAGTNKTLSSAVVHARNFVKAYPLETKGRGLMLIGKIGTGKTHLAVALLKALITERGAKGLFYDCTNLLDDLKNSYEKKVSLTEREVLTPIFNAEVLVLDELGAAKITDWASDSIARVINTRYNDGRTTIVTSNYDNLPPAGIGERDSWTIREETLGDRIGERMRSRLQEMCVPVYMEGLDYRQLEGRASFASDKKAMILATIAELPEADRKEIGEAFAPVKSEIQNHEVVLGRDRLGRFKAPHQPQSTTEDW